MIILLQGAFYKITDRAVACDGRFLYMRSGLDVSRKS